VVYRDPAARRNADQSTVDLEDSRILGPWELWLSAVTAEIVWLSATQFFERLYGARRIEAFASLRLHEDEIEPSVSAIRLNSEISGGTMLRWAIAFFVVALIAAVLGFGGIAVAAAGIAKFIFYIFAVLFVISLLAHLFHGGRVCVGVLASAEGKRPCCGVSFTGREDLRNFIQQV
jgi:uncharacterized membrane protein YtjA (UPF0391 family)